MIVNGISSLTLMICSASFSQLKIIIYPDISSHEISIFSLARQGVISTSSLTGSRCWQDRLKPHQEDLEAWPLVSLCILSQARIGGRVRTPEAQNGVSPGQMARTGTDRPPGRSNHSEVSDHCENL